MKEKIKPKSDSQITELTKEPIEDRKYKTKLGKSKLSYG